MSVAGLNNNNQWYAVRVRSQHEDMVARHLRVRGLEAFLPLYRGKQRWSDRFKEIDFPLFPGYVFCRFDPADRLPVLTVPGVVHLVGTGKNPVPIDGEEIQAIQVAVGSGSPRQPWPYLEIGQRVRIEHGPLCGVEGILLGARGNRRLVLSITLLQRSVAVEINEEWVRPMALKQAPSGKLLAPERFSHQAHT
jgi:transcription antitermination factor NusG